MATVVFLVGGVVWWLVVRGLFRWGQARLVRPVWVGWREEPWRYATWSLVVYLVVAAAVF